MKIEPSLDYESLVQGIDAMYGLSVQALAFIPEGECSIAYRVRCSENQTFIAKLWGDNRVGQVIRAKLDYILPLMEALSSQKFVQNLPAPIPTQSGELYTSFNDYALALFPFIDGHPVNDSPEMLTRDVNKQIAETMAHLHQATYLLHAALPPQSAFAVNFGNEMRWGLEFLDTIGSKNPPGQVRLRDLLLPQRVALLANLERLEQMQSLTQDEAHQNAKQLVLCHTDMGGNNVLVDSVGRVFILDWDDLVLAPPEQDLQEYRGPYFADFVQAYRKAGGVRHLSALQFRFYLLRRYLGDLNDWLMRILTENTDPEQDASDLHGIETYCLARLARFDEEIEEIARVI